MMTQIDNPTYVGYYCKWCKETGIAKQHPNNPQPIYCEFCERETIDFADVIDNAEFERDMYGA